MSYGDAKLSLGEYRIKSNKKTGKNPREWFLLAGVAGIGPAHVGFRDPCLTTWLHPKAKTFYSSPPSLQGKLFGERGLPMMGLKGGSRLSRAKGMPFDCESHPKTQRKTYCLGTMYMQTRSIKSRVRGPKHFSSKERTLFFSEMRFSRTLNWRTPCTSLSVSLAMSSKN